MKNIWLIIIILLNILGINAQSQYPKDFFSSPVDIKIAIAGTFGELRNNHFHSGIDIKTKQRKNIPIYAAQDGYVSRIKVSTYGFGKALYINHAKGFTTVYAHLEKFNPKIQQKTNTKHYEKESFELDFTLPKDEVMVKKGELIGFSGNTGSSTAPHLHFEIRDTKTQKIINPMFFGLPILDRTYPKINAILLYHQNGKKEIIKTKKINSSQYKLPEDIHINQPFNIGINTYDLLDAAPNKNGIYSIELYINDTLFFHNQMSTFSFNETRYINSHIDYAYYQAYGKRFQKCFLEPNNYLSTNQKAINAQIGDLLENGTHNIKIIVKDSYENSSVLEFNATLNRDQFQTKHLNNIKNLINSKQVFEFKDDNCEIYIPNHSLYKDYHFEYEKTIDSIMTYPIYHILHDSIPTHKSFIISIKTPDLDKELRKKALLGKVIDNEIQCIQNSKWKENKLIGKSNTFGAFTIVIDTIKPVITQENISTENAITFHISDELSGIKEYRGEINGKWVLMEYDFKTNILQHNFNNPPQQINQNFKLSVSDHADNIETINMTFFR